MKRQCDVTTYRMNMSVTGSFIKTLIHQVVKRCLCVHLVSVISVDLTDSSMAPGGRRHQRLLTGLTSRLQLKTDFLLSHPPGECCIIR